MVACAPADRTPEAEPTDFRNTGDAPSGPYAVAVEYDPGLDTHTIYRPEDLSAVERKLPIVVWGNGGCIKDGLTYAEYLSELASHGMLVISDGAPNNSNNAAAPSPDNAEDGTPMISAIEWAIAENQRPCSKYYNKLEITKLGANGSSCGGMMTIGAGADPRLTALISFNSGLFEDDKRLYDTIHTPLMYITGGSTDFLTESAQADFAAIDKPVPLLLGIQEKPGRSGIDGHVFTFFEDNGGIAGNIGVAWFKWHLMGDDGPESKGMFAGADCGLCKDPEFTVMKKNMD